VNVTLKKNSPLLAGYPSLAPFPTATNICALVIKLVAVQSDIPSHQLAAYGYTGLVEQREVYVLTGQVRWYEFGDPRPLRLGTDGSLSPAQQVGTKAIYDANRSYKNTENNIRHAVNTVLNRVVPDA
jgi:hypothetical protein